MDHININFPTMQSILELLRLKLEIMSISLDLKALIAFVDVNLFYIEGNPVGGYVSAFDLTTQEWTEKEDMLLAR